MSDKRKLAAEMERTLKKISEGMEIFDRLWTEMHEADSQKSKDRLEEEINKETKKMQRMRDQVRAWIAATDIKDKEPLHRARRDVESRMEKLRDYEREAKLKLFSRAGLELNKIDAATKAKMDANQFLSDSINRLYCKIEQFDSEVDTLEDGQSRKKFDREKQEKLEFLEKCLAACRSHLFKFEMMLRMLDNESLTPDTVFALKDEFDFFYDELSNGTIHDTENMYYGIDFEEGQRNEDLRSKTPDSVAVPSAEKSEVGDEMFPLDCSPSPSATEPSTMTPIKHGANGQKPVCTKENLQKNIPRKSDAKTQNSPSGKSMKSPTKSHGKNQRKPDLKKTAKSSFANVTQSKSFANVLLSMTSSTESVEKAVCGIVLSEPQAKKSFAELLASKPQKTTNCTKPSASNFPPVPILRPAKPLEAATVPPALRLRMRNPNEGLVRTTTELFAKPTQIREFTVVPSGNFIVPPTMNCQVSSSEFPVLNRKTSTRTSISEASNETVSGTSNGEAVNETSEANNFSFYEKRNLEAEKSSFGGNSDENEADSWTKNSDETRPATAPGSLQTRALNIWGLESNFPVEWNTATNSINSSIESDAAFGENCSVKSSSTAHSSSAQTASSSDASTLFGAPSAQDFFNSEKWGIGSFMPRKAPLAPVFESSEWNKFSDEVLFYMYYHQGKNNTILRLQAARCLELRNWRFYEKTYSWMQRLQVPRIINSDYERGDFKYWNEQSWREEHLLDFLVDYRFITKMDRYDRIREQIGF